HTRSGVHRIMRQLPPNLREGYVRDGAVTEDVIRARVASLDVQGDSWFDKWRSCFVRGAGGSVGTDDLKALVQENSLIGWAAASLLRRCVPEDAVWPRLLGMMDGLGTGKEKETRSRRWRVVHVLGMGSTPEIVNTLLEILRHDAYRWVKYGATR